MESLRIILTVIFVIDCIALTVVVLAQEGKQQGLGTIAGAADSYWGKNKGRSMEGALEKITKYLAIGFIILLLSFIVLIYCVIMKLVENTVSGWTFIVCSIWLIGGIQILCLGVIGEYIGKIYKETKARPRYLIECILD